MEPAPLVLLVEDHDAERELLSALLTAAGYRVAAAADGAAALALLARVPRPRVALVNLRMPVMDGFAFLREACARGLLDGVPVITLSALPRGQHPKAAAVCLEKPFDPTALLVALRECGAAVERSGPQNAPAVAREGERRREHNEECARQGDEDEGGAPPAAGSARRGAPPTA
jgi:CheY-like chemotaxis protein